MSVLACGATAWESNYLIRSKALIDFDDIIVRILIDRIELDH